MKPKWCNVLTLWEKKLRSDKLIRDLLDIARTAVLESNNEELSKKLSELELRVEKHNN
jgi:hypothetical protein